MVPCDQPAIAQSVPVDVQVVIDGINGEAVGLTLLPREVAVDSDVRGGLQRILLRECTVTQTRGVAASPEARLFAALPVPRMETVDDHLAQLRGEIDAVLAGGGQGRGRVAALDAVRGKAELYARMLRREAGDIERRVREAGTALAIDGAGPGAPDAQKG